MSLVDKKISWLDFDSEQYGKNLIQEKQTQT